MPEMVKQGQGLIDEKPVTDLRSIDGTPLIYRPGERRAGTVAAARGARGKSGVNVPTTALITMTDIPPTYVERRPVPQSTVQAAAQISGEVVEGLGRSPAVLGMVVLVAITVGAAIYFLQLLIHGQQQHLQALLTTQREDIQGSDRLA